MSGREPAAVILSVAKDLPVYRHKRERELAGIILSGLQSAKHLYQTISGIPGTPAPDG